MSYAHVEESLPRAHRAPEACAPASDYASLYDRVAAVLPAIEGRAQACEEARMVPQANVDALRATGYLDAFKPAAYGGLEVLPSTLYPVTRALAGACPSTAWAMQLLIAHAHAVAYFDPRAQDEIWGQNEDALISSSVAPMGKITPVDGGYRLSGRYAWSSGCDHGQWSMVGFFLPNEETGKREHALALVPRSDYEIVDTWQSAAMKGTGSKDLHIDDVFVPDYRVERLSALNLRAARGYGVHKGALFTLPFQPLFGGGFSVVALGIATRALALYGEKLKGRIRAYTGANVKENVPSQVRLAEAGHEIHAASLVLAHEWASFDAHAHSGEMPEMATMVGWRTNHCYAIKLCVSAVTRLFMGAGGGSLYLDNPFQRLFRDIQATALHAYTDYDTASQIQGRFMLDLPMDERLF